MPDISFLAFPLSAVLAAAFAAVILYAGRYGSGSRFVSVISGRKSASILCTAVAVAVAFEGTFGTPVHRHAAFWVLALLLMLSLGLTVAASFRKSGPLSFKLTHTGFLVLCAGIFFGAPDFQDVQMVAYKDITSNQAFTATGEMVTLPFEVTLSEFRVETYDDEVSPKQFVSRILVDGQVGEVSVNHPLRCRGYLVYQADFDREQGRYSVLKAVRDPWLPVVWLGMILLAAGTLLSLRGVWKSRAALAATLVLAAVFAIVSLAKLNLGTLMPALRSLWFVPHIIIYMLAYALLAISLILCVASLLRKDGDKAFPLCVRLFRTASSLLLLGMLCGAVWAKMAWGDYWTWDAKECWAAVTWMLAEAGLHLPSDDARGRRHLLLFMALAFVAMQVTWYGVGFLPASHSSLHTYN